MGKMIIKNIRSALMVTALAQGLALGANAEEIALQGGTAFSNGGAGKIENATILVKDGKIESVSAGGAVPAGYRVIDAQGQWVTTGFMAGQTSLGLLDIELSGDIVDASFKSADGAAGLDVADAFNPSSSLIPITRIEGVTRAAIMFNRGKGAWLGQGAVAELGHDRASLVKQHAFMFLDMSEGAAQDEGGSRASLWAAVIAKLDDAKEASAKPKKAKEADDKDKTDKPDPSKMAFKRLFAGEAKLLVEVDRASDIRRVIDLKARYGLDIVILHGDEAWREAEALAKAGIAVVLNPLDNLPETFDRIGARLDNAAILHKAGVKIAFMGPDTHNARLLPQLAGNAVANGLPWEAAVDAITKNPAEIFGVNATYGTMTPGLDADLVVWDGDPLELASAPTHVLIQGAEIALESRQTKLRDRYKNLPQHPAFVQ